MKKFLTALLLLCMTICTMTAFAAETGYTFSVSGDYAYVTTTEDFVGNVFIASYTEAGALVDTVAYNSTILRSGVQKSFSVTELDKTDASGFKLFLWEDTMEPYEFFDNSNEEFNTMTFNHSTGAWSARIISEADIASNCRFDIINTSGTVVSSVTPTLSNGVYTASGTIPSYSHSNFVNYFIRVYSGDKLCRKYAFEYPKAPTQKYAKELVESMKVKAEILDSFIEKCHAEGLSTDYEDVYAGVLKTYTNDYIKQINDNNHGFSWYTYEKCMELYDKAIDNCVAYLNGTKSPMDVPKYVTSKMEIDGVTLIADTMYRGEIERRPVHFLGYNYQTEDSGEIPAIASTGANFVQREFMMSKGIVSPNDLWEITTSGTASATLDTNTVNSGTKSMLISNTSTSGSAVISQQVALKANTTYYIGFVGRATGVTKATLTFGSLSKTIPTTTLSKWREFAYSLDSGNGGNFEIKITVTGKAASLYLDDFYVCAESKDGVNMLKNPGFETDVSGNWAVDAALLQPLVDELEDAEKHNVGVDFLLSTHNVPAFIKTLYPDTYKDAAGNNSINYTDTTYRAMVSDYLDVLLPIVGQYDCVKTICLMNEPGFNASAWGDKFVSQFRTYLQGKYGTIETLNSVYGTSYSAFSAVPMPSKTIYGTYTVKYRDYFDFNNTILAEHHQFLANKVKEHLPEIPVHTKNMWYLSSDESSDDRARHNNGIDYELIHKTTDLNGGDAVNYQHEIGWRKPMYKTIWYDYTNGIEDVPSINSEDHMVPDHYVDSNEDNKNFFKADLWQNAFHGRALSASWAWTHSLAESSILYGGLGARPDYIAGLGEVVNDLNRLSYEVQAVAESPAEVVVMYSDSSRLYNEKHLNTVYNTYEALYYRGYKAQILTENHLDRLDSNVKMVVIPDAPYVCSKAIDQLLAFANRGGKIVMIGQTGLTYNENGQKFGTAAATNLRSKCQIVDATWDQYHVMQTPTVAEIRNILATAADSVCSNVLRLYTSGTTTPVDDVEYMVADYNGKKLISICNYNYTSTSFGSPKTVDVYLNGKKLTDMVELRSGEYVGDSVTVKVAEPVLLEYEDSSTGSAYVNSRGVATVLVSAAAQMATATVTDSKDKIVYAGQSNASENGEHTFVFSIKNYDPSETYTVRTNYIGGSLAEKTLKKIN